ncbi:MAG: hypothetical protein MUD14_25205 [Hydrococcus sp. Prado102]|jgi:hypothetical protein|nr:hypothetical protein [Hydrococcus sp. Prado102]
MIISDLNYIETIAEDTNIEGAGEALFDEAFSLDVNAQRKAFANVLQAIKVNADAYKTINFIKSVKVEAYV